MIAQPLFDAGVVLLVSAGPALERMVREGLRNAAVGVDVATATDAEARALPDVLDRVTAVLVGPEAEDPIRTAELITTRNRDAAFLLAVAPERLADVRQAIVFAPMLSDRVSARSAEDAGTLAVDLADAADATRRRRAYRDALSTMQRAEPQAGAVGSVERLGHLFEAAPIGVLTADLGGVVRACTRHGLALLGRSDGEVVGRPVAGLVAPGDRERLAELLVAAGAPARPTPSVVVGLDGPEERYVSVTAGSFTPPSGRPALLLLLDDATARVLAERELVRVARREHLLARVGTVLDASLEPGETLDRIARLVVPDLADLCVIESVGGDGVLTPLSTWATDPEATEAILAARAHDPLRLEARHPVSDTLRSGVSRILDLAEEGVRARIALGPVHRDVVDRLDYRSAIIVPLVARGRLHGALSLVRLGGAAPHTPDDLVLAEEYAARAAIALDNVTLYDRERTMAETLQRSLLPELRAPDGVRVAARYRPGSDGTQVGGDFYDLIRLEGDRVGCLIGDVEGRGLDAAAVMGELRAFARAAALGEDDPARVLAALDRLVDHYEMGHFATAAYLVLDLAAGTGLAARAGHPPPLLVGDGPAAFLDVPAGPPIGAPAAGVRRASPVAFAPGDLLLLYSDGLVERRGETLDVGLERLREAAGGGRRDPDALCDRVLRLVRGTDDDVAVLALQPGPRR